MRKRLGPRKVFLAVAVLLLIVSSVVVAIVGTRATATSTSSVALIPSNFAALKSPNTARPAATPHGPGPEFAPAPGTVHALGEGAALAWVSSDARVCWSAGNASGCAENSPSVQAIDITISDPDQIGRGEPVTIHGLAVDGVAEVVAVLTDGSRLAAAPVNNWYEIALTASAAPWDVSRIQARLDNGQRFTYDHPTTPPPGL